MAALVESMFSVREVPWHGLGTIVQDSPTSADAIRLAGLDWEVSKLPIYDGNHNEIKNYYATTRSSDNSVLGIVGDRYQVVQNHEAFDFTDSLIGEGMLYETAGSLKDGRTIWLLGKLPEQKLLGDEFVPYICFTNSHDGTGAIKVCMTPTRVVCNNTLNLALNTAKRMWSTRHVGDISAKLEEAKQTLMLADKYMAGLNSVAETLATEKMSEQEVKKTLDLMFPTDENSSKRAITTAEDKKEQIMICMLAPDLANFQGTKWQFLNAVADYTSHTEGNRKTSTYDERRWGNIIDGHNVLDMAYSLVAA